MKISFNFLAKLFFLLLILLINYQCSNITEPEDSFLYEDSTPAWSPDGKKIAYYHYNDQGMDGYEQGLYVIDNDGQNRQLTKAGQAYSPDWSPDGKQIVFSDNNNIFTININGTNLQQVTNDVNLIRPNWSPVDKKIVFGKRHSSSSGKRIVCYVFCLDLTTEKIDTLMPSDCGIPDWYANEEDLLYIRADNLFLYHIISHDTTNIINLPKYISVTMSYIYGFKDPVLAPDRNFIALYCDQSDIDKGIWIFDRQKDTLKFLTDGSTPSFSPDSKKIVFRKFVGGTKFLLYTVNVDGSEIQALTK